MSVSDITEEQREEPCYRFGKTGVTYGWIKCLSKTYPNTPYYYNTKSGNSTWKRPVPDDVPLPVLHSKTAFALQSGPSNEQCETDIELFNISDNQGSDSESSAKKADVVLSTIYNGVKSKWTQEQSDIESSDSYEYTSLSDCSTKSVLPEALVPEVTYYIADEQSTEMKHLQQSLQYSSSDDNNNYDSLHVKNIDLLDLRVTKPRRRRKRPVPKDLKKEESESEVDLPGMPKARVCEIDGVCTVNYDISDFPKAVKQELVRRNLSDSSEKSSGESSGESCECSEKSCCDSDKTSSQDSVSSAFKRVQKYLTMLQTPHLSESSSSD